jgi:hypothetical protein
MSVKEKFCVIRRENDKQVARKDTYADAEQDIKDRLNKQDPFVGDAEYYILKIYVKEE